MKTFLFGSLKGCLLSILSLLVVLAFLFMIIFDFFESISNNRTYFFDFNKVTLYDEPIFTDYEERLIKNLNNKNGEIADLRSYFSSILPPEIQKIEIEVSEDKFEKFIIKSPRHSSYSLNHDFNSKSVKKDFAILKWNTETFDILLEKLNALDCTSISTGTKEPFRMSYIKGKSGTFLYNFYEQEIDPAIFQELNDSCTFKYYKENIFFEYEGSGRGPDCKRTTNHKNTEKSMIEKWRHLLQNYEHRGDTLHWNLKDEDYVPYRIKNK